GLVAARWGVRVAYVASTLVLTRGRPRARGRYGRIQKPFSQITITVREVEADA
ncbi:MAG: uL22 family ribosomal protein, partial [Pseudomonadota bacterium]